MKHCFKCIVFALSVLSFSQNCNLTFFGEVRDFHDNSALTEASIYVKSLNTYMISDKNGRFKIENLCPGNLTLVISHIACETVAKTYKINSDVSKTITLEHHIEELNEVGVNAKMITKITASGQESVIKNNTIDKYSNLSLGDVIKEIPGVSSINTGNAIVKPIINGMYGSRILILNNDVRLHDQEWGIEHAPNIDINSAEQISVIKGSGALAYGGDAIGGVIIVKPKRLLLKDTLFGKSIVSGYTNGRGFNVNTSIHKSSKLGWFGNVQASFRQNGDFKAADYNLTNTGAKSTGVSARFGKKTFTSGFEVFYSFIDNKIGILRSAHIGNAIDLANSINAPKPNIINDFSYNINPPKQEVTHHLFKAKYYKRFKNFGKVTIQYDYQNNHRFEFDRRRAGRSVIPAIDLKLQTHTILANTKIDNNQHRKINFGLLGRYQNHFANPETGVRRLIPDYDKYDFGAYTTTEWYVNNKLSVDAGLRYDYNRIDALKFYRTSFWESRGYNIQFADLVIEVLRNQVRTIPDFDYHNLSGGLGATYNFNTNNYLLANYNLSSRAPNPSELFSDGIHHSAARYEIGDLRIDSERSHRMAVTYGYSKSKFNLQIDAFYNYIHNYIYLVPTALGIVQTIRGPFPQWEYIQTNANFYGIDLNANYNFFETFNYNHKSSFIKGYDVKANLPLLDIPPFTTHNSISYSNTKWYNFNASLQSEWGFEQNEFPTEFNYSIQGINDEDIGVDLSPPAAYHLMHFNADITLPVFKQSRLNIRVSVDNIFNTSYRNYLNRLRFFADDLGRNVRLQLQLNF